MGDGGIAAVFRGLAADATSAARNIVHSVGGIAEKTADIEESNLRNLLDSDSRAADSFQNLSSEVTLARMLVVNWRDEVAFDYRGSRMRLMGEFLRRSAWWARQFGAPDTWPFYDLGEYVAPGVAVSDELSARLEELIRTRIGWPGVAVTCRAALHWAAVLDAGARPDGGEDPYEPLLLFFERGGGFTTESGFIEVYGGSVRRGTWHDHIDAKPVDISPASLDALDAQANR